MPNHLHVPWSVRALEAGKPVLSEKPVALSLTELDQLEAVTRRTGLYLYDGYMVRYHPQWDWIRGMDVGTRKIVNAHFSYPPQPEGNIRNIAAWGGGPIWDIGCYCLLSGMMLFDGTPELVAVHKEQEEHLDVEKTATAIVDFGNGQTLHFTASSGSSLQQSVTLVGTDGWAKLDVPFNASRVTTARWAHRDEDTESHARNRHRGHVRACDQYQLMVEDFTRAVAEERHADLSEVTPSYKDILAPWSPPEINARDPASAGLQARETDMLEGQIAVVTGGAQGIGFAVASLLMNAAHVSQAGTSTPAMAMPWPALAPAPSRLNATSADLASVEAAYALTCKTMGTVHSGQQRRHCWPKRRWTAMASRTGTASWTSI